MVPGPKLDAHEKPPCFVRDVYKKYQKLSPTLLRDNANILDLSCNNARGPGEGFVKSRSVEHNTIRAACYYLQVDDSLNAINIFEDAAVFESPNFPGLQIIPAVIPAEAQTKLLSLLLHRDLADHRHTTNVHLHHRLPYHATIPFGHSQGSEKEMEGGHKSFFNMSPTASELFLPIDVVAHKPFTVSRFLERKLRWVTLGGQYDWSRKCYPDERPAFPTDIAGFIQCLFPEMRAEAAIVNVYTPGDTLSIHRDVSEESAQGLVSISLGCDAIFVVGMSSEDGSDDKCVTVRLRSGDIVFMKDRARFAWHGVPRIIGGTCPEWFQNWPARTGREEESFSAYEAWQGWMSNKRINLNVRQMKD